MSLDYPLYEEMVRRRSRAAPWWRIGDSLYYIGLLTAIISIPVGWAHFSLYGSVAVGLWCLLAFICGAAVWFIGALLKSYSYRLAERDGIDPSQY
jgi:hypothetical protein